MYILDNDKYWNKFKQENDYNNLLRIELVGHGQFDDTKANVKIFFANNNLGGTHCAMLANKDLSDTKSWANYLVSD